MTEFGNYGEGVATFGDRLTAAREGMGLGRADLARKIGVREETLAEWEDDRREPRANRLSLLAGVTGASLSWLLTGEGDEPASLGHNDDLAGILADVAVLRAELRGLTERAAVIEKRLRAVAEEQA